MQSVLISIRPQWCKKIASGKKTLEIRKTRPKLDTPFKVYIYQTQNGMVGTGLFTRAGEIMGRSVKNGKVIGEFVCDNINEYSFGVDCEDPFSEVYYITTKEGEQTGLGYEEFANYGGGKTLYGWHISDLQIYDKPKELSEFYHYLPDKILYNGDYDCRGGGEIVCMDMPEGGSDCEECPYGGRVYLKRPPESWRYVEELEEPCKTKN